MNRILNVEIKKAVFSLPFLLGMGMLLIFAIGSAFYMISNWQGYNPQYLYEFGMENEEYLLNPNFPLYSVFSAWLGGEMMSLSYTLFFSFLPVGAALPYAWSFHAERKSGYLKNILTHVQKKEYFFAKFMAIFVSGVLAVFVPYVVNIFLVSAYIPYYRPWAGYNMYNLVHFGTLWADLFFEQPVLHMFLYTGLSALYGGIFAVLSFAVSFYFKNVIVILLGPFLIMMLAGYIENLIVNRFFTQSLAILEAVPTYFLHSRSIHLSTSSWVVFLVTVGLLLFSIGTIFIKGMKNEIY